MNARLFRLFAILALAVAPSTPCLAADPPKCRLIRIAEWPVRLQNGLPIIEGSINGKKIGILLDTGAYASLITKSSAEKLGLATRGTSEFMIGVGGESRIFVTRLDEFKIGDAVRTGWRVRVGGERPIPGVDFVLGDDFFKLVDLEFDYAKGVMRLFQPENCKSAHLGYWDPGAMVVPLEDADKIIIPIQVNGRAGRAMVDSGASGSLVSLSFAASLGITPESPGVLPSQCASGLGANIVRSWVARFDTVTLGGQNIRDPQLRIVDLLPELSYGRNAAPEMLLGTDFLRTHRMLVSRSQDKVYFSYTGGLVFPATPGLGCQGDLDGKTAKEVLAGLDEALAANPNDAQALVTRATLRLREKDGAGALADLDAALRLAPNHPVALATRSDVRAVQRDYEGALADADAAIANGMRTAPMYVGRAWIRRYQGDLERAIAEYDEALKLDPRHPPALRGRGATLFHAGRFAAAEADFSALLATRPNGFDSLWLSLARSRQGKDGVASLDAGLAKLRDGQWPAPILMHLLGRMDRETLNAAASADEKRRASRECQLRFYTAEHLIAAGRSGDARPLLEKARDECPTSLSEYSAVIAELAKLP